MRVEIHALKKLQKMIRSIANGMIEILCGCIRGIEETYTFIDPIYIYKDYQYNLTHKTIHLGHNSCV